MAATQFGVIVTTVNAIIRGYIYPDSDAELAAYTPHPDETLVLMQHRPYMNTSAWQAAVNTAINTALGKTPGYPAVAVLDGSNTVRDMFCGDAALDSHAGGTTVQAYSPMIGIGCTYDSQTGLFYTPQVLIPAGTPDRETGIPSAEDVIIPPQPISRG
jgi:hypothetical protein